MEIKWTEKLKPDLKSLWNFETVNECPMRCVHHANCLDLSSWWGAFWLTCIQGKCFSYFLVPKKLTDDICKRKTLLISVHSPKCPISSCVCVSTYAMICGQGSRRNIIHWCKWSTILLMHYLFLFPSLGWEESSDDDQCVAWSRMGWWIAHMEPSRFWRHHSYSYSLWPHLAARHCPLQ